MSLPDAPGENLIIGSKVNAEIMKIIEKINNSKITEGIEFHYYSPEERQLSSLVYMKLKSVRQVPEIIFKEDVGPFKHNILKIVYPRPDLGL